MRRQEKRGMKHIKVPGKWKKSPSIREHVYTVEKPDLKFSPWNYARCSLLFLSLLFSSSLSLSFLLLSLFSSAHPFLPPSISLCLSMSVTLLFVFCYLLLLLTQSVSLPISPLALLLKYLSLYNIFFFSCSSSSYFSFNSWFLSFSQCLLLSFFSLHLSSPTYLSHSLPIFLSFTYSNILLRTISFHLSFLHLLSLLFISFSQCLLPSSFSSHPICLITYFFSFILPT